MGVAWVKIKALYMFTFLKKPQADWDDFHQVFEAYL